MKSSASELGLITLSCYLEIFYRSRTQSPNNTLTLNMIHFHFVTLLYFTGHGMPGRRNVIPNSQLHFPKEKFEELRKFSISTCVS